MIMRIPPICRARLLFWSGFMVLSAVALGCGSKSEPQTQAQEKLETAVATDAIPALHEPPAPARPPGEMRDQDEAKQAADPHPIPQPGAHPRAASPDAPTDARRAV